MNLDAALITYIAESRELLEEMETRLLQLENAADRQEELNAIFRTAHTIKGSAGLFGLNDIVDFTHGVESLLDLLRNGSTHMNPELMRLLLSCRDHIGDLVELAAQGNTAASPEDHEKSALLTAQLQQQGAATRTAPPEHRVASNTLTRPESAIMRLDRNCVASDNWHISLRFDPDLLRNGMDPMSFLRYLGTIGEIVNTVTLGEALPDAQDMDPETCYLGFEISFDSSADKQTIEDAFSFVREGSHIHILPPRSHIQDYIELIQALPEEDMRLGDILVRCGSLTHRELEEALRIQAALQAENLNQPLGNIVMEGGMTPQPVLDTALEKQQQVRQNKNRESHSVRVDAEKLDHLINLVGELVIANAGSAMYAHASGDGALIESLSTVTRLVEDVRDSTLRLRMVQIGSTFNRFQRVVRDISAELGKEINLIITGAETELDKSVVEKINDPLLHLVRNSIDHGIEPVDIRLAAGKPASGTLRLNAYHDSGSIVIEVADDGAGLNRDRILQKAVDAGLAQPDQILDDQDIDNLIFEPGFSTADTVTNLSGRGVGMDVVKRNITALRGTVELTSSPGNGTTFRIRMPLTLAIIDGFQVDVQKSSYVVPLDMVMECVELNDSGTQHTIDRDYINLRGEVLPIIRMRDMFALSGEPPRRENVVVVQYAGNKAGLVVDQLLGEFQTVIKPLGRLFNHVKGVSGSTILGNGEVALILDVPGLVQQASIQESHARHIQA